MANLCEVWANYCK